MTKKNILKKEVAKYVLNCKCIILARLNLCNSVYPKNFEKFVKVVCYVYSINKLYKKINW